MTFTIYFAKNIKHLRKVCGYSQQYLAGKLGVKRTTITNYESGLSSPDYQALIKIATIFDVSIDALLMKDLSAEGDGFVRYHASANADGDKKYIVQEADESYKIKRECQLCRQKDKTIEILQESLRHANQMLDNYAKYQQQLIEMVEMLKKNKS